MMDLADVHDRGHAGVDLRDSAEELVDVDVIRTIDDREVQEDRLVIIVRALGPSVVDEDAVALEAAQRRLELVAMRVDVARAFLHVRAAATTPVQRLGVVFAHLTQPYQPSPKGSSGRPAHRPFRGLLGVQSRCGPHTRAVT
jgi:hypothetical protein